MLTAALAKVLFSASYSTSKFIVTVISFILTKVAAFQPLKAFKERVTPKGSPKDTGTAFVPLLTLFPGSVSFSFWNVGTNSDPLGSIITLSVCLLLSVREF